MDIILKTKEFIKKLQGLPLWQRKIILLTITIIIAVMLLFFWWHITEKSLRNINSDKMMQPFKPILNGLEKQAPDATNSEETQE